MAILDANEIFYTAFEPRMTNRFIVYMDGIPSYLVKGVSAVSLQQTAVPLNHINVQRYVKGKTIWQPITFTMYEAITPSGAQAVMEWVRLGHVVSEWIIKGAVITSVNFGDYNWDDDGAAVNITVEVQPDYCILNY